MGSLLERENKLQYEIAIINQEVLKHFPSGLLSIILYGSYGRDEGAFYYDEVGDIRTYNDFDIILVVDKLVHSKKIQDISDILNEKLDVKWIDLSQKVRSKLRSLELSIFNYDLKHGSRVIFGDQNVFNEIPDFKVENINLKEAETLYFTRIWAFLGSLPVDGFERELTPDEVRFFNYQMAKAVLAVIDVKLLLEGKYTTSYKARVKKICEIYVKDQHLVKWAKWAIDQKICPSHEQMNLKEVKERYKEVLELFLGEMYSVLSVYYKKKIDSPFDIKKALFWSMSELVIFFKVLLKTRSFDYLKKVKLKLMQSFLAEFILKNKKEQEGLLKESKKLLKQIDYSINVTNLNWHELRLIVSELRLG